MLNYLYTHLIKPKSLLPDDRRQELVLNIMLVGLLGGSLAALTVTTINAFSTSITHFDNTFAITIMFNVVIIALLVLSRTRHSKLASLLFLALLTFAAIELLLGWGFMLPTVLLLQVMLIVIAGVLLHARWGLMVAIAAALVTLAASYFYQSKQLQPDTSWLEKPFHVSDAIGYAIIFIIIGIVSWLSNREIDASLKRARQSEAELAAERDLLEVKVAERTHQLEEAQLVRMMELQRFAEFGRLNANLLHEIANPLTAATLNLELLGKDESKMVLQARKNLKHLERYISAARQQIRGKSEITNFSVRSEIKQLLRMLEPRANKMGIDIVYTQPANYTITGDAAKFSQLVANLLVNAVDAYGAKATNKSQRNIELNVTYRAPFVEITVHDFGNGITKDQIGRIFEPFFTTKTSNSRSLGIGLAMVKQFVENDFGGTIDVSSTKLDGTTFTVRIKRRP